MFVLVKSCSIGFALVRNGILTSIWIQMNRITKTDRTDRLTNMTEHRLCDSHKYTAVPSEPQHNGDLLI